MDVIFLQLLVFGILAAGANVLGGLVLFPSKLHKKYKSGLKYVLALGAGYMLAVIFVEILPKAIDLWSLTNKAATGHLLTPLSLVLAGYLITQFFEHTIAPHFHLGEEVHSAHAISASSAYSGVAGLLIHTLFDGISIAAATLIDIRIGFLMFIAIFLHKIPEGFTIGSMILAAGKGFKEVVIATSLIGFTTVLGVVLFYFIGSNFESTVAYALPLSAGITLYVAASDLIPEVNHHGGKNPLVSLSVFAGVAIFFAVHFLTHDLIGH